MTLADLPVGREDLLVLLKKLIRFIHIKVERVIRTLVWLLSAGFV